MSEPVLYRGKKFLPVPEVSQRSNLSANYIAAMARENRIDSIARGDRLLIAIEDVEDLEAGNPYDPYRDESRGANGRDDTRPLPGQTDYFARPVSRQADKVAAFLVALALTGGIYIFNATPVPAQIAASVSDRASYISGAGEVLTEEISKKVARDGVDDLVIDSVLFTAGEAVASIRRGLDMTHHAAASVIRGVRF